MVKFYKLELSGEGKSLQARDIYFACVGDDGKVASVLNKPALRFTDGRYLKAARFNVDMAYDRGQKDGLDGVKSWMLSTAKGRTVDEIKTTEISPENWERAKIQLHKSEKLAIVCQLEKGLHSANIASRTYEDISDLEIKELRLARAELLTNLANKNEFPEYKLSVDEVRTVLAHNMLKNKFDRT